MSNNLLNLNNQVAAVIGASSGIGRETALLLAKCGASVVLCARNSDKLEETAKLIRNSGGKAAIVIGDATLPETHISIVRMAKQEFGGLNIAVNNVGVVGAYKPLAEVSLEEWHDTIDSNLTAAFLGACSQIPVMIENGGGSIVFTSSFVGNSVALPNMAVYGVAKAALTSLVKGITADYAEQGIRANALLPGGTNTDAAGNAEQKAWAASLHAVKRIADPKEIASAILFLCSPMSSFVMGSSLFADGGNSSVK